MTTAPDALPNHEQATYWNEQAGRRWVALQKDLDAELETFGVALMKELPLAPGARVLDVGCGAAATSRMLAEKVRPGSVLGVDISDVLLTRARELGAPFDNLHFERADAQTFAFAPASYDVVFSRFGVMFFADPVAAFRNLRAALRPGGALGFVCWRAMGENPTFTVALEAALPFLPDPPAPPVADAPGPFAFADRRRIEALLTDAGFETLSLAAHDTELVLGGRRDLEGAVERALQIGPLGRALGELDEAALRRVRAAVRAAFAPYHGPSGVTLRAATWLVTARNPS